MKPRILTVAALLAILAPLVAPEAAAWGPRARRAIGMASVQLIRTHFSDAFKAGSVNYESDVIRGAEDGVSVLRGSIPLQTDEQSIAAINQQIQLLRAVRKHGTGSYFAYRMGVLSALVAQVVQPYGLAFTEPEKQIKELMDADVDRNVDRYSFAPLHESFVYIRSARDYIPGKRGFYSDDRQLLHDDYTRGRGYRGLLAEAGPVYFQRSIQAVADAWYTIFRVQGDSGDIDPSPRILTWYFVDEIGYLLDIKRNFRQAERAYEVFDRINPGIMESYEIIGDKFYAFGESLSNEDAKTEAKLRGVGEWKKAFRNPGEQRRRASKKLASHYIEEGEGHLRNAAGPGGAITDLEAALRSFNDALGYERSNPEVANYINETTVAIADKRQRRETQQSFIDKALSVMQRAEASRLDGDFSNAIITYSQAMNVLNAVNDEFKDLRNNARDNSDQIRKALDAVVNEVFDRAQGRISDGEEAVSRNQYEEAIQSYSAVEEILSDVPDDNGPNTDRKQGMAEEAQLKIEEAKIARTNYEQEVERQRQQQQAGGGRNP